MKELCGPVTCCCVSVMGTKEVPALRCTDAAISSRGEVPSSGVGLGSSVLAFFELWRIVPAALGVPSGLIDSGDVTPYGPAPRDVRGVLGFLDFG